VSIYLTSKDNLVVEWTPTGMNTPGCDWKEWWALKHRHQAFTTRPSNELLFVHHVGLACRHLQMKTDSIFTADDAAIEGILLQATFKLVEDLKRRLEFNFEVRMVTDIFPEWVEVKDASAPLGTTSRLVGWNIENVAERTRRHEIIELEKMAEEYRCSAEDFMRAFHEADQRKRTGPPLSPHSKDERITKVLKKSGHASMTLSVVRRYRELLERYRPKLFPAPPMPPNVVPIRQPKPGDSP
jgi:hypothetical protein